MSRIQGILLDFYGTLVEEDEIILSGMCDEIFALSDSLMSRAEIAAYWSSIFVRGYAESFDDAFLTQRTLTLTTLQQTIERAGSSADASELAQRQFARWTAPPAFADAAPFLNELKQRDISICVISNIDRADLEAAIHLNGFEFDFVLASDDVRAYKPNVALFESALELLNLPVDNVLHIGDSWSSDVCGAQAAGIPVAWLNRNNRPVRNAPPPTWIVHTLLESLPLLT